MALSFTVDTTAQIPPFEQLRTQIADAVRDGRMAAGERLPTVRRLAENAGVAAGTVARAYRELEAAGVVETRGRNGTFVSFDADAARGEVQRAAVAYADLVRSSSIDPEEGLRIVAAALSRPD